jgi:superfamily I DNA/RNA helicase
MVQLAFDEPAPAPVPTDRLLVAGLRGSGKSAWLAAHINDLLRGGVPARSILVVTFSPRAAARLAADLPAEVDAERPGGLWLSTAAALCRYLLRECCRLRGIPPPRVLSAVERATLLHAAVERARHDLGDGHPLAPALGDRGGLAEMEVMLDAVLGQGGSAADLLRMSERLPEESLDRAVLVGLSRVVELYRAGRDGIGDLAYQEVTAATEAMLADAELAGALSDRFEHLAIDDLDRAEPTQIQVLAHLAGHASVVATVDPTGLFGDRARRAADLARTLLRLDVRQPSLVLPDPPASPVLARFRSRLGDVSLHNFENATHSAIADLIGSRPDHLPTAPCGQSGVDGGGKDLRLQSPGKHEPAEAGLGVCDGTAVPVPCQPESPLGEAASGNLADGDGTCKALLVVEAQTEVAEAARVSRLTRAALAERETHNRAGEPDVLLLLPAPTLRQPVLAALRAEGIEAVDDTGNRGVHDTAVRYALSWLDVVAAREAPDESWERLLSSPLARVPAIDLSRLRAWADTAGLSLESAAAASDGCEGLVDAARLRLRELLRLRDELRASVRGGETPTITLHRLLAREDLVGALLVGPLDAGAAPPDPRGLAALCTVMSRLEELWPRAYGRPATLPAVLDRLQQGIEHMLERDDVASGARVVVTDLERAADRRARVVIVCGLAEAHLPRPRRRSPLLSTSALDLLRELWALPWPADVDDYARGERRALSLAVAAARERVALSRALRYEGQDARAPSPVLLDGLGVNAIDSPSCKAAGAHFSGQNDSDAATARQVGLDSDLIQLSPEQATRDLELVLYRHARRRATYDRDDALVFVQEARAILAAQGVPVRERYLSVDDPFASLPSVACTLPPGARVAARAISDYLYCPRRFYYGMLAGLDEHENERMAYGLLVARAAQALHRLYPDPETATVDNATAVLQALWDGTPLPGEEGESSEHDRETFAGRFGPRLHAAAMRMLAGRVLQRLVVSARHPQLGRRTRAAGVSVEVPFGLPDGRSVRVSATIDRIVEKVDRDGVVALGLIDYRSGGEATPSALVRAFLNSDDKADWRPTDFTLPLMFLGLAQNKTVYDAHDLPRLPVRELAVASLGKARDGYPIYSSVPIVERGPVRGAAVTLDDLVRLKEVIANTVAAAATGPHRPAPSSTFRGCDGCVHRFVCPGPGVGA